MEKLLEGDMGVTWIFLGLIMMVSFILWMIAIGKRKMPAACYQSVKGVISDTTVVMQGKKSYFLVSADYTVDGNTYRATDCYYGHRVNGHFVFWKKEKAEDALKKQFPEGKPISVYYLREKPEKTEPAYLFHNPLNVKQNILGIVAMSVFWGTALVAVCIAIAKLCS